MELIDRYFNYISKRRKITTKKIKQTNETRDGCYCHALTEKQSSSYTTKISLKRQFDNAVYGPVNT